MQNGQPSEQKAERIRALSQVCAFWLGRRPNESLASKMNEWDQVNSEQAAMLHAISRPKAESDATIQIINILGSDIVGAAAAAVAPVVYAPVTTQITITLVLPIRNS